MKAKYWLIPMVGMALALTSCKKEGCTDSAATNYDADAKKDDGSCMYSTPAAEKATFKVTLENVSPARDFMASGSFATPDGASAPGPAMPGNSYSFTFPAAPGAKLSFATMYVQSNDLFFGASGDGIELFNGSTPVTGDVTSQVLLIDAGTEVNQMPGTGADQAPRQSGPNTGAAENGTVREISMVNDGFTYGAVNTYINVILSDEGNGMMKCTIENLTGSSTPIAPGVWVVHQSSNPIYTLGQADPGKGLEGLAEDGSHSTLASDLEGRSGIASPFAPGVFAVHNAGVKPLFTDGAHHPDNGLEALAEDGNPATLEQALAGISGVTSYGVFNTPVGATDPGGIGTGGKYEFTFTATKGQYLSLATMFVFSNDAFSAPADGGIALWDGNSPISGDISSSLLLWDAGSEVNQYPGSGPDQPAIGGPETGTDEHNNVQLITSVGDGFSYPASADVLKVTITVQ
ncbi:spondin domain-containing protein [bacterium SCSIO 12741]|nr:spondin domain-containing protein [bacterium SCSIO 12741]